MPDAFAVPLDDLQPSQCFLSDAKLASVLQSIDLHFLDDEPLPVATIDGELVLLDGHHRAFVLFLAGADDVQVVRASDDVDVGPYRTCVGWCREAGITTVGDFVGRVLDERTFEEEWIDRCHDAFDDD